MTKTTHSTSMNNDEGNIGIITNERQIENLEEDQLFIMVMETFVQQDAKTIGLENMEIKQSITLED